MANLAQVAAARREQSRRGDAKSDPHARDTVGGLALTGTTVNSTLAEVSFYDPFGLTPEYLKVAAASAPRLEQALREKTNEADRWKAKSEYWQAEAEKRGKTSHTIDASKIADEIMARIERDGAVHRDALVEVVQAFGGPGPAPADPVNVADNVVRHDPMLARLKEVFGRK